jgi:hypothetical protein
MQRHQKSIAKLSLGFALDTYYAIQQTPNMINRATAGDELMSKYAAVVTLGGITPPLLLRRQLKRWSIAEVGKSTHWLNQLPDGRMLG